MRKKTSSGDWDAIFPLLAHAIAPAELAAGTRARMSSRVIERARRVPPAGTWTQRADEGEWQLLAAGVTMKLLRIDRDAGNQTALVQFSPGSSLEQHEHTQEEECLVLEGEIMIGSHTLHAGDVHFARPGTQHAAIRSAVGALLLVRSDIVMTGSAGN
jgi:anti-sigma factor ChrR (cupin superfamily)